MKTPTPRRRQAADVETAGRRCSDMQMISFSAHSDKAGAGSDTYTLADGITRRALFNVWNEEQDPKRGIDAVLSLVRSTTDFDKYENQQQLKFKKIVKNVCLLVGEKWMRCHRNEKFFSKSNDA
ncbi:hypothetical protein TNCV_825521 [Trichonephila clavipes]|nr:hypothetical protein TNCV_825521 [Trichonephila clavipes]